MSSTCASDSNSSAFIFFFPLIFACHGLDERKNGRNIEEYNGFTLIGDTFFCVDVIRTNQPNVAFGFLGLYTHWDAFFIRFSKLLWMNLLDEKSVQGCQIGRLQIPYTGPFFPKELFRIFDYLRLREQKIVQFIVLSEIWIKMGKKSRTFQRNWKEGGYPLEKCKSSRTMYGSWSHNLTQLKSYSTDHEGPFPRRSEIFKILHTSTRHSKFGMCMKKYKGLVTPN